MTPSHFLKWLEGLLNGSDETRAKLARPDITTDAKELINGELRDSLVVIFPGASFVISANKVGPEYPANVPGLNDPYAT